MYYGKYLDSYHMYMVR